MLMHEATPDRIKAWKSIYAEYKSKLRPNRKGADQIIAYLRGKYPLTEIMDEKWKQSVMDTVVMNDYSREKLPLGKEAKALVFSIINSGTGKPLYEGQDEIFLGQDIYVGIEIETGYFHVEGSSYLWDELFAYRGLDDKDLNNYYLVAEYITCLKKFDMLDNVLV